MILFSREKEGAGILEEIKRLKKGSSRVPAHFAYYLWRVWKVEDLLYRYKKVMNS